MGTFDLRGTIITFSLLQISNHFKGMAPGEVLEIVGCDEGIARDLKRLLPASKYELLGLEALGGDSSDYRLRLKKIS